MTELKLSEAEKQFITSGVKQNIRIDGRSCLDYRNVEIETSIISNCFGSAHIRLGNCDVMAAVKVDLANMHKQPGETENDKGRIEFYADLSANADPFFEGRLIIKFDLVCANLKSQEINRIASLFNNQIQNQAKEATRRPI